MTRQKKELHKKIQAIEDFIAVDTELGCGFAPAGFYETLYAEINGLQEQLAQLSHYGSAVEMMMDTRGQGPSEDLPF